MNRDEDSVHSGCTGKAAFPSGTAAQRAASNHARRKGAHLQAYRCRHCGKFHLGGAPKPRHGHYRSRRLHLTPGDTNHDDDA